ncbi:MAG: hypothetical protein ABI559_05505 [Chloroflexota bacterium]
MRRKGIIAKRPTVEPRALIFIVVAALAIVALTFRTWVDFNVAFLRGTDADAMTGIGDGYFVIALALLAIVCTVALYLKPSWWATLLPAVGLAAVSIAAVAAYQAASPWHATGFDIHGAYVVGGHATAAVYEIFVLAAAMGLAAALLAGLHYQRQRRESNARIMPSTTEGTRNDQTTPRAAGRLGSR